jgi:hypothetical protein
LSDEEAGEIAKQYVQLTWVWDWTPKGGGTQERREILQVPKDVWDLGVSDIADFITQYFADRWAVAQRAKDIEAKKASRALIDLSTDWYAHHRAGIEQTLRNRLSAYYKQMRPT